VYPNGCRHTIDSIVAAICVIVQRCEIYRNIDKRMRDMTKTMVFLSRLCDGGKKMPVKKLVS